MAKRVLIVEDHPPTRRMLEETLASAGIGTDAVANGAEALAHMAIHPPDLVLTDFIMPHLNGIELVNAMRAKDSLAKIPVVFVTAVGTPEVKKESAKVGVRWVLIKPITKEKVLSLVDQILARPGSGQRPTRDSPRR